MKKIYLYITLLFSILFIIAVVILINSAKKESLDQITKDNITFQELQKAGIVERIISNNHEIYALGAICSIYHLFPPDSNNPLILAPFCGITGGIAGNDKKDNIDEILKKLRYGNISFNSPTKINIEDAFKINLSVILDKNLKIAREIKNDVIIVEEKIKVSNKMHATLSGSSFKISEITPKKQAVSKDNITEWSWEIRPTKHGNHKLYLTVSILANIEGETIPRKIKTYEKTIDVEVTTMQLMVKFVTEKIEFVWSVLFIPFLIWIWNVFRRNNKAIE